MRSRTSTSPNATDTIPPRPASRVSTRDRNATTRAPSSRDSAPATTAAAISPCECPTTASGSIPHDRHNSANDTITAHNTGCTTSTRPNKSASSSTSANDQSTNGSNAAAHSDNRPANTGDSPASSRAIPTHCEPCPGNTNTTRPGSPAAPSTNNGCGTPSASAASASGLSATARRSNAVRVVASEYAADAEGRPGNTSASRAACARSASGVRADITKGTRSSLGSAAATGSPCSRMTWALVPLTPNDDTAARAGRSSSGHDCASVSNSTAPADQSTCDVGRSTCNVLGSTPRRIASTTLITPATPAAAWV